MNIINYTGDDIIISLTREELQLLRSLVIEIYAGVCIDAEEFEIVSGIRNSKLVQELEQQLIEAYDLMDNRIIFEIAPNLISSVNNVNAVGDSFSLQRSWMARSTKPFSLRIQAIIRYFARFPLMIPVFQPPFYISSSINSSSCRKLRIKVSKSGASSTISKSDSCSTNTTFGSPSFPHAR